MFPPQVMKPVMAYDAARRRVVLLEVAFWEWDGTNWARRAVATPPGRLSHAMAYDAVRQRVVLFGGGVGTTTFNDTWEWDGNTWVQRMPANRPPARTDHCMAYDAARGRVVLSGGMQFTDTWEWDGNDWTQARTTTNPVALYDSMAYDAVRHRMVLFDGVDTWEYGYAGTIVSSGSPRPGSAVTLTLTASNDPGRPYQVGTSLGTGPIHIDTRRIDLSPDDLLRISLAGLWPSIFSGYRGVLDSTGQARASIHIPNVPALIGTRLHCAYVTIDLQAPSSIRSISNTESISIVK